MNKVVNDTKLGRLVFGGYTEPIRKAILKNTGHTAQLTFYNAKQWIGGESTLERYRLMQLHFHWGLENERGSEHTVDGKRFPLEMHLVHYNERYKPGEAAKKPDGLAVLAVLFELSKVDNEKFETFFEALQQIKEEDSQLFLLHRFNIANFIPEETFPYFRYKGSLTTPPCYESVTWTLLMKKQKISKSQKIEEEIEARKRQDGG
ncbi:carbonic anhydrase 12-like [Centruroides vittatus]|uniref:carbonic anhydrase 12-like n=1 Tax=Centruroides vittatus TaxID=120091 RepID=UPI00351011EF